MKKLMFVFFLLVMTGCGEVKTINLNGTEVARVDGETVNIHTDVLATPSLQSQNPPNTPIVDISAPLQNTAIVKVPSQTTTNPPVPQTLEEAKAIVSFTSDPYSAIDWLDRQQNKATFKKGSQLVGPVLIWIGWFDEGRALPQGLNKVLVDPDDVGIFFLESGYTITTVNDGAMLVSTSSCLSSKFVINIINMQKGKGDELYVALDQLRTENSQTQLILRPNLAFKHTNIKTLVWGKPGFVASENFIQLDEYRGKALYLATVDGSTMPVHAGAGLQMCDPGINPETDFPWWNK